MKIKLLLLCFAMLGVIVSSNAQENANALLDKAYARAKKENKKVFVMFHASWCGWCKKMDKNMQSEACGKLFDDNYVTAHLTVLESPKNKGLENPGAEDILKKYNAGQAGLPFWVILDTNGKLLADSFNSAGQNLGCPASEEEVAEFAAKLKKTSALTDKQLAVIKQTFTVKK